MNVCSVDEYLTRYKENKYFGRYKSAYTHGNYVLPRFITVTSTLYILQIHALINTGKNASITRFLDTFYVISVLSLYYSVIMTLIIMYIHRLILICTNIYI
jgi:hypothetical protein